MSTFGRELSVLQDERWGMRNTRLETQPLRARTYYSPQKAPLYRWYAWIRIAMGEIQQPWISSEKACRATATRGISRSSKSSLSLVRFSTTSLRWNERTHYHRPVLNKLGGRVLTTFWLFCDAPLQQSNSPNMYKGWLNFDNRSCRKCGFEYNAPIVQVDSVPLESSFLDIVKDKAIQVARINTKSFCSKR